MENSQGEVTRLVAEWSNGDPDAFDRLVDLIYDELKRIAHHHVWRESVGNTVDTTMLVHEAYLKLAKVKEGDWRGRAQFFAFCSKAMRRILIDFARRRNAQKRGGAQMRVPLDDDAAAIEADVADILAIEDALEQLESRNERMARIVECRFFGGMTVQETADALDTSVRTVEREWTRARAYLHHVLAPDEAENGPPTGPARG